MKAPRNGSEGQVKVSSGLHPRVSEPSIVMQNRAVLFAHDTTQATCAALLEHLHKFTRTSIRPLSIAGSAQAAAEQLRLVERAGAAIDLAVLCLDLPPAPTAGIRLANYSLEVGVPVVLVTRSMHWLAHLPRLAALPWLRPDASRAQVEEKLGAAIASFAPLHREDGGEDGADPSGDRVSVGF